MGSGARRALGTQLGGAGAASPPAQTPGVGVVCPRAPAPWSGSRHFTDTVSLPVDWLPGPRGSRVCASRVCADCRPRLSLPHPLGRGGCQPLPAPPPPSSSRVASGSE